VSGILIVRTGLRIGAGKDTIEIGGVDNPVVKHPHSGDPYIPGSSLKGKIRSLLEWALGKVEESGDVYGSSARGHYDPRDPILRAFGTTTKNWEGGPSRLLVRDAHLEPAWRARIVDAGLPLTEDKSEVTINRIQGKAASMGPRVMERVPSGARFEFEMLFREYSVSGDDGQCDREAFARVIEGMRLLEQDALGGAGSRGCGRVEFASLRLNGADIQTGFDGITSIDRSSPNRAILDLIKGNNS
jgi:CRISPR-associated protein Csm3